jgi:heptosyltransferase-2
MADPTAPDSPILVVPYMWIGDFVRCHSVVRVLRERWPSRPVDFLTTSLCAPLVDYMPGLRKGIEWNLPRRSLPVGQYMRLSARLKQEHYGTSLIMLRTWKSALAPFLAGIPERVGFAGEMRFGLLNDVRFGEFKLERMVDRCASLALPKDATHPSEWPLPELLVPQNEIADWRARNALTPDGRPVAALCPGAVGRGKRWPTERFAELAKHLTSQGVAVWILGGPNETSLAKQIAEAGGALTRDLTGNDLRNAILALAAADITVSNDSGLMHVAAAIGTPTIGLFGPTSPRLWAPLNPLAAIIESEHPDPCPTCGRTGCDDVRHRSTENISLARVAQAADRALAAKTSNKTSVAAR